MPEGVRDVIGQRLRRLSEQCNQALTTASVVGREFDFRMLGIVLQDISEPDLLGLIDEALEAHLIEEAPGQGDLYQFTHALVQQTLSENLSTSRKVRLHARIGEVLETMYGDSSENHAAELAHHFTQAAPVLGTDKLIRYGLMAGEKALAAYAHEEALGHFAQGLQAKQVAVDDDSPVQDEESARLLFGFGRVQAAILRRGASQNLTRAFDYYAGIGEVTKAVEVAKFPMAPGVGRRRVTDLISRALELVPPDSLEAASLLSRYGWALGQEIGDCDRAMSALNQALEIAQQHGDESLEMSTRANAAEVHFFNLHLKEVLADSESLLAGALFVNSGISFVRGDWFAVRSLTDRGLGLNAFNPALMLSRILCEYETGNADQGDFFQDRLIKTARAGRHGPGLEIAIPSYGIPMIAEITGSHRYALPPAAWTTQWSISSPRWTSVPGRAYGLNRPGSSFTTPEHCWSGTVTETEHKPAS